MNEQEIKYQRAKERVAALRVFGSGGLSGADWEERKIREIMENE